MQSSNEAQSRVRISVGKGEFEVEGSQEFVNGYKGAISQLMGRLNATAPQNALGDSDSSPPHGVEIQAHFQTFPEALHALPKNPSATDLILVAGYYAKRTSGGLFATRDANSLLLEQGVKVANASQSLTNNLNAKRVFKVGKLYKVSKPGEDHLRSLGVLK